MVSRKGALGNKTWNQHSMAKSGKEPTRQCTLNKTSLIKTSNIQNNTTRFILLNSGAIVNIKSKDRFYEFSLATISCLQQLCGKPSPIPPVYQSTGLSQFALLTKRNKLEITKINKCSVFSSKNTALQ